MIQYKYKYRTKKNNIKINIVLFKINNMIKTEIFFY